MNIAGVAKSRDSICRNQPTGQGCRATRRAQVNSVLGSAIPSISRFDG